MSTTTIDYSAADIEVDSSFMRRPVSCAVETIDSSDLSSPRLSMTDFSNHLNIAFGGVDDTDVECLNPDIYHLGAAAEDPYGWEAELDHKLINSGHGFVPTLHTLQYRRAGGTKRSLLHRVFSLGPRDTM